VPCTYQKSRHTPSCHGCPYRSIRQLLCLHSTKTCICHIFLNIFLCFQCSVWQFQILHSWHADKADRVIQEQTSGIIFWWWWSDSQVEGFICQQSWYSQQCLPIYSRFIPNCPWSRSHPFCGSAGHSKNTLHISFWFSREKPQYQVDWSPLFCKSEWRISIFWAPWQSSCQERCVGGLRCCQKRCCFWFDFYLTRWFAFCRWWILQVSNRW